MSVEFRRKSELRCKITVLFSASETCSVVRSRFFAMATGVCNTTGLCNYVRTVNTVNGVEQLVDLAVARRPMPVPSPISSNASVWKAGLTDERLAPQVRRPLSCHRCRL